MTQGVQGVHFLSKRVLDKCFCDIFAFFAYGNAVSEKCPSYRGMVII